MFNILRITGWKCTLGHVGFQLKMVRAASIVWCAPIKAPPGMLVHIPHCKWSDPYGSFKSLTTTNSIDKKSMENRDSFLRKLFENTAILKRSAVVNFADIIKISSWIFQKSVKVKKNHKEAIKMQSLSLFSDITKIANFQWEILMLPDFKGYLTWFINILDYL